MLIGELAEKTGATVRMLRYYDQHGLLTPQRTQGRYRVYDESDVERVRSVRCLISSGLNIRLVRLVLAHAFDQDVQLPEDEAGCVPLLEMLTEELTSVEARITQLTSSKAHLTRLVGDVTRIMAEKFGDRARCRDAATEEAPGTSAEGLHSGRRAVRA
ncbi:DNA-binding transcriptional MerR regulator [Saccharothrix ecbatanensis]|uniref:DNA-binding transcriptional MerR regulator n=1 Tax=Saccharothrix ecbatanensis TaxID=1105145 RepID=A0A7W9HU16_9PSEU|nr:MerR family transcriptional regulator [Saccharothrix ecbatanensis]MBB5808459.1 DNA-binding transcriptional MerR regulator [Saccharothrix ecbatanensis]